MSREGILDGIRGVMADVFDIDVDESVVNEGTTADAIDEWDSLSHIRLIVAVERKFAVKFTNQEIESLKRVGDLVTLVEAKTKAKAKA
jgi:acyl carrier protein